MKTFHATLAAIVLALPLLVNVAKAGPGDSNRAPCMVAILEDVQDPKLDSQEFRDRVELFNLSNMDAPVAIVDVGWDASMAFSHDGRSLAICSIKGKDTGVTVLAMDGSVTGKFTLRNLQKFRSATTLRFYEYQAPRYDLAATEGSGFYLIGGDSTTWPEKKNYLGMALFPCVIAKFSAAGETGRLAVPKFDPVFLSFTQPDVPEAHFMLKDGNDARLAEVKEGKVGFERELDQAYTDLFLVRGGELLTAPRHLESVTFSPIGGPQDGSKDRTVAFANTRQDVMPSAMFPLRDGRLLAVQGHVILHPVGITPTGKALVNVIDPARGKIDTSKELGDQFLSAAVSADGTKILLLCMTGDLLVCDSATLQVVRTIHLKAKHAIGLAAH